MAGKGYGADATLVAAAYRLGQSYVPKDYSKIFEKQYEGIIAANQAKAQAKIDYLKNLDENIGDFMESYKEDEDEIQGAIDDAKKLNLGTNDYTDGMIREHAEGMENGESLSEIQFNSAENGIQELADQYEKLKNNLFKNKEQRREQKNLKREILEFKPNLQKARAAKTTAVVSWDKGFIDKKNSFKGNPNLKALWNLTIDKTKTEKDLNEMGITSYWKNGKQYYEYPDGLWGTIYGNVSGGGADGINIIPAAGKIKYTISEKDLLAQLVPVDTKTAEDANGIGTRVLESVDAYTTNKATGGKYLTVKNFSDIEEKVEGEYFDVFMKSENINYIATNKITVGNQKLSFIEDYRKDRSLNNIILETAGIGSDVISMLDVDGQGSIGPEDREGLKGAELEKHNKALDKVLEIFTDPKTSAAKEELAKELAKYRKDMLREVFNTERARLSGAKRPVETTTPTTTTLFGKTVPIASTGEERSELALVRNIESGKSEVTVKNTAYTYDPKTETYSYKTQDADEDVVTATITRERLIQRASEVYGNITSDWFTTGMNTILMKGKAPVSGKGGKKMRLKDYELKDGVFYLKGTKTKSKHQDELKQYEYFFK